MVNCYVEHVEGGGIWDVDEFEATTLKLRFDGKNLFVCVVIILILYFVANFFLGFVLWQARIGTAGYRKKSGCAPRIKTLFCSF